MSADLLAALCLVLVLEGLLLFVAPGGWKQAMAQMLERPERELRIAGAVMIVLGLMALQWVR